MKLVSFFEKCNKSFIYNEYINIIDDYKDYEKISRNKMLNEIILCYKDNPGKILEYCNEKELKLLEKLNNNKTNYHKFDELYRSLYSKFFVVSEGDKILIPDELKETISIALKNIDYKQVKIKDEINKRFIGIMKLYGIILVDMLADMYNHYYNDFKIFDDCKNYILKSFYLRHYIFIDEDICIYNDYYNYYDYAFDNMPENLDYKYFEKEQIDSISNSKYNIDDKYVNEISNIFKENKIPLNYVDTFVAYAKETLDKAEPIELIERRIIVYLRLFNNKCNINDVAKKVVSIFLDIPCVIYKGYSLIEMMHKEKEKESIFLSKQHGKKISNDKLIKKYKKIRRESIDALELCGDGIAKENSIMSRYMNLFNINKIYFDLDSLLCYIITFIAIDDEEPYFYKFFKENISINNKYYEILNDIKNYNYSSLFLVEKINVDKGTILLRDTKTNKNIEIIDISLSANKDLENNYIYTSLFKVDNINFTVGYIIPFVDNSYDKMVNDLKIEKRRILGCKNPQMIEILAFYKLYCKNKNISFSTINVV